jgi:hypothetical protein
MANSVQTGFYDSEAGFATDDPLVLMRSVSETVAESKCAAAVIFP